MCEFVVRDGRRFWLFNWADRYRFEWCLCIQLINLFTCIIRLMDGYKIVTQHLLPAQEATALKKKIIRNIWHLTEKISEE